MTRPSRLDLSGRKAPDGSLRHWRLKSAIVVNLAAGTGVGLVQPFQRTSVGSAAFKGSASVLAAGFSLLLALFWGRSRLGSILSKLSATRWMTLAFLVLISVTISAAPAISIPIAVRCLAGLLIAAGVSAIVPASYTAARSILDGLGYASIFVCLASVVLPSRTSVTIDGVRTVWTGFYAWNSTAGMVGALALVGAIAGQFESGDFRVRTHSHGLQRLAFALAGTVLLVRSASRGSQMVALGSIGFGMMLLMGKKVGGPAAFVSAIGSISVLAGLLLPHLDAILLVAGKTRDLSGRSMVWATAIEGVKSRPIGGYGLGAFWVTPDARGALYVTSDIEQAHNQFLQILLDGGFVALLFFVFLTAPGLSRLAPRNASRFDGYWYNSLGLIACLVSCLSNSFLLRNNVVSVLFLVCVLPTIRPVRAPQARVGSMAPSAITIVA